MIFIDRKLIVIHNNAVNSFKDRRKFYRHPLEYPIQVIEILQKKTVKSHTINLSEGGICFSCDHDINLGTVLQVAIPLHHHLFKFKAEVIHSVKDEMPGLYLIGVSFLDKDSLYQAKIAEEILSIEKFRNTLSQKSGREVSQEDAAKEWVKKNAALFATFFSD